MVQLTFLGVKTPKKLATGSDLLPKQISSRFCRATPQNLLLVPWVEPLLD
jgi:hypothetical protein